MRWSGVAALAKTIDASYRGKLVTGQINTSHNVNETENKALKF